MKQQINPENFTEIMGAYSHGLRVDIGDSEMIFVTGQIAMDKHGNPVAPDDIVKQTEFVFQNIVRILEAGGSSIDDVVKAVIYVTNISDFKEISTVRNRYFANCKPVSTLVEINKTVKEGCDIEVEVIAIRKK
ncbi:MAG: RidA family protein [Candidatus Moranbacteria bacterium]|nr:RidA family protein [Candidatus Moranbacteria bacterium]NTW89524.1 RidA family protein [Candidatus Moranbacteria bacterium]HWQ60007.1 RidA family protein [Candidatus Fimivivens sp.]